MKKPSTIDEKAKLLYCDFPRSVRVDIETIERFVSGVEIEHCRYFERLEEVIQETQDKIRGIISVTTLSGEGKNKGGNLFDDKEGESVYEKIRQNEIPVIIIEEDSPCHKKNKEMVEKDGNQWISKSMPFLEVIQLIREQFNIPEEDV